MLERFMEKVQITDSCWLWLAVKNQDGYGRFRHGKKLYSAHRVSYELHIGPIPEGLCVLHSCDTPACVNPSHLFLGTQNDNIQDMERKGRAKHPKNTRQKVKVTREMYKDIVYFEFIGKSQTFIANKFGISQAYVGKLLRNGY
jgi:hypothetical protein